jgi:hypothetical protein
VCTISFTVQNQYRLVMIQDFSSIIQRFGVGSRGSSAVVHQGTGYFAVTPQSPYDGDLSVAEQTR